MQIGTTGILNDINERYYCSSKRNTVAIQELIRIHKIKSQRQLIAHIEYHKNNKCSCGIKSNGTLESFAQYLWVCYNDYVKTKGIELSKTYDDCLIFMRTLFITHSLRGNSMEDKVKNLLISNGIQCKSASMLEDFKYAVDLITSKDGKNTYGIQVKPLSYKNFAKEHKVVQANIKKNNKYPHEVLYVYYNKSYEVLDIETIIKKTKESWREIM